MSSVPRPLAPEKTKEEITRGLTPKPVKIRFYLDSFRVQIVARKIAGLSHEALKLALSSAPSGLKSELNKVLNFERTPARLAELLSGSLQVIEDAITKETEEDLIAQGHKVVPAREIDRACSPFSSLFSEPKPLSGDSFVNVQRDGFIFAPKRVNYEFQTERLRKQIFFEEKCGPRGNLQRLDFLRKNLELISKGKLVDKAGKQFNFAFSQDFVDRLSHHLLAPSREGVYQILWSDGPSFSDERDDGLTFGEKGVDADLIIAAMDDLWRGDVDVFVFLTHDGDFAPLVRRIIGEGKQVRLCGGGDGNISNDLMKALKKKSDFFEMTPAELAPELGSVWLTSTDHRHLQMFEDGLRQWRWEKLQRDSR